MTIESICKKIKSEGRMSDIMENRVISLANEFTSLEAFVTATKGKLFEIYNKAHPKSSKGLGRDTLMAIADVAREYRAALSDASRDVNDPDQEKDKDAIRIPPFFFRKYTKDDLLLIAGVMEQGGIKSMDAMQIATFLAWRDEGPDMMAVQPDKDRAGNVPPTPSDICQQG